MRDYIRIALVVPLLCLLLAFSVLSTMAVQADEGLEEPAEEEEEPEVDPPELEISPESGTVGTKVYVTVKNFEPDETVEVYFSDITEPVKTWPSDGDGYVHTGFKVPEYPAGRFRVIANDGTNNLFVYFTLEPCISIGETSGCVGDELLVEGRGFADDEDVTLYIDGTEMGSSSTDSSGSFNTTCVIPPCGQGRQTIKVEDEADNYDTVDFVVRHSLSIEPVEGTPGMELSLDGDGFNPDTDVSIMFGEEEVDVVHTGHDGSFTAVIVVPGGASGAYQIKADDGRVREYAQFELVSSASISASGDTIGSLITVTGSGYLPRSEITFSYDRTEIESTQSTGTGSFNLTFPAPRSASGEHTVTVSDGTNSTDLVFTVESNPPPSPTILGPDDATKAAGQIYFDWQDVEDPSGVFYSLQIARDSSFSQPVILESALLSSEYLLPEDHALERTGKEAPYYWRVRAYDLAGNESDWSTPRTFEVGFMIEMPTWAMYSLLAIGAFLLVCVAVWGFNAVMGRRRTTVDDQLDEGDLGLDDLY